MKIKLFIASLLTCSLAGKIIAWFYKNRIPFRGLVFDTSIPEILPASKAMLFWKIYESAEIRFIAKYLTASYDVIELGSSIGVVSSLLRKQLDKDRRLICVEAYPALCGQLAFNLKLNRLDDNVECLNKALSYNDKSVLFAPGDLSTTGKIVYDNSGDDSIEIEAVTLSSLKSTYNINEFTLVADIEGEEVNIIRKDKEALKDCKHLFMELHDTVYEGLPVSVETMLNELINIHGFTMRDSYGNVVYLSKG